MEQMPFRYQLVLAPIIFLILLLGYVLAGGFGCFLAIVLATYATSLAWNHGYLGGPSKRP